MSDKDRDEDEDEDRDEDDNGPSKGEYGEDDQEVVVENTTTDLSISGLRNAKARDILSRIMETRERIDSATTVDRLRESDL